jgi:hypothetical protein
LLGVAAVLALIYANVWQINIPGPYLPPSLTAERTMTAYVSLDADHPQAIQRFSVTAADAGNPDLLAVARTNGRDVGLTILADDGGSLSESWNDYRTGPSDNLQFPGPAGQVPARSRQYLALVELPDPSPPGAVAVTLTVIARAVFIGPMSTPAPSPTIPPDFDMAVTAAGPFATTAVSRIQASYRETIQSGAGPLHRTLRLNLSGAAAPASAGGSGHPLLVVRPVAYTMPSYGGEYAVHGTVGPIADQIIWGFSGSIYERSADVSGTGGDPSSQCRPAGAAACQADLTIDLDAEGEAFLRGSAPPEPETLTLTFEVLAIDYLIGAPSVPAGAGITLTVLPSPAS